MNEQEKLLAELNGEETANQTDELNETVVDEPKDEPKEDKEEKIPFGKDPKVLKFIDKKVKEAMAEHKPTEREVFVRETKTDKDEDLLDAFTAVIGNDTPEKVRLLKQYDKTIKLLEEKGKKGEEALEQLRAYQEAQQAESKAMNQLSEGFETIKENYSVDLNAQKNATVRNDFIDFIKVIAHKNDEGDIDEYPDFDGAFKLFQDTRKSSPTSNRAKELASRSMQRSGEASAPTTPKDYSWRGVRKMIEKLGN